MRFDLDADYFRLLLVWEEVYGLLARGFLLQRYVAVVRVTSN